MKKIVVGITGASGSIYAKRMIEVLVEQGILVHVIATDTGKKVFNYELSLNLEDWITEMQQQYSNLKLEDNNNLFAGVASGSYGFDAVIILPCSMGTMAEISHGLSSNLLCRGCRLKRITSINYCSERNTPKYDSFRKYVPSIKGRCNNYSRNAWFLSSSTNDG